MGNPGGGGPGVTVDIFVFQAIRQVHDLSGSRSLRDLRASSQALLGAWAAGPGKRPAALGVMILSRGEGATQWRCHNSEVVITHSCSVAGEHGGSRGTRAALPLPCPVHPGVGQWSRMLCSYHAAPCVRCPVNEHALTCP